MTRRNGCTQDVLLLSETASVEFRSIEAEGLYAADHDMPGAWELDFNQQTKNEKTGEYLQVISARSKRPVQIFKNRPKMAGQSTQTIASNSQDRELTFQDRRKQKNSMVLWLGIIAVIFAIVISIIVLVNMKDNNASVAIPGAVLAISMPVLGRNKYKVTEPDISDESGVSSISKKDTDVVLCLVNVEETGVYGFRNIARNLIPGSIRERELNGQPFFMLTLTDGKLWGPEPDNDVKEGDTPLDLYLALDYEQEVDTVYGLDTSPLEKVKIGILVALCFILIVVFFLIAMTAMGGNPVG